MASRRLSRKWLQRAKETFVSKVRRKRNSKTPTDGSLNGSTSQPQNQQDLMIKTLYDQCYQLDWFDLSPDDYALSEGGASNLGVVIKSKNGSPKTEGISSYTAEPRDTNPDIIHAVARLDLSGAFTSSSDVTRALLQRIEPNQTELSASDQDFVLPIFRSLDDLGREHEEWDYRSAAVKAGGVCLCRRERVVLVWSDNAEGLVARGRDVEAKFIALIRASAPSTLETTLIDAPKPQRRHPKGTASASPGSRRLPHTHASHASDEVERLNIPELEQQHSMGSEVQVRDDESFDSEREFKRRHRRSWLSNQRKS